MMKKKFMKGNEPAKTVQGSEETLTKEIKVKIPQILRGFKDILPAEQPLWNHIRELFYSIAQKYRFERIDTPIVESTSLFKRSVGEWTDIVEKEMFSFVSPGGDHMSLRPEVTASVVRAYIEHGMFNLPQPVKFAYLGPVFRYDRPQAGRYRQFHHCGFEMFGEAGPAADAQIMLMTYTLFQKLGLDVIFAINSLGDLETRNEYKKALVAYYKSKRLSMSKEDQKRLLKNPLRLLDSKEQPWVELASDAPQLVEWLSDDAQAHFMGVLEYLDELDIPYIMDHTLVRGLDYYNRTTFEIYAAEDHEKQDKTSVLALGGGGRYDSLVEQLGGRTTPAIGMACGLERIILKMKEHDFKPPHVDKPLIMLAQIGAQAKMKAVTLFENLYDAGLPVVENYVKDSLKSQLELADRLNCRFVLILGQKEVLDNTILIRDMEAGIQEVVDMNRLLPELRKKLEGRESMT